MTGAQGLARKGVDLWAIQHLGRWGGATVQRYVADVPLEHAARLAASRDRELDLDARIEAAVSRAFSSQASSSSSVGPSRVAEVELAEELRQRQASAAGSSRPLAWVTNPSSGISHRCFAGVGDDEAVTLCGWHYRRGWHLMKGSTAPLCTALVCARCAPDIAAA